MSESLDLLVLAAGRGERLRPLTNVCPKPLLPLLGRTLADVALEACLPLHPILRRVNAHHLPDEIVLWAESRGFDDVQFESILLNTGGALAKSYLEGKFEATHVLVHNGDIYHDIDLRQAWEQHQASKAQVTLVVVDRPKINTVAVSDGKFSGVIGHALCPELPNTVHYKTFAGIAFYRCDVFAGWPAKPWIILDLWHTLLTTGEAPVIWEAPANAIWEDCGTPSDFRAVIEMLMAKRGLTTWKDKAVKIYDARVGPGCCIEYGAEVGDGADLEEVVLLPGAVVASGERLRRVLRNPGGDAAW